MKIFAAFLFLFAFVATGDAQTSGAWSALDHGLRARLFIEPSHDLEHDATFDLFVEFQNIGEVSNLGVIRESRTFNYSVEDWKLDVLDSSNHALPHSMPAIVDEMISSSTLCLPFGAKLSMPIGSGGSSPPRDLATLDPSRSLPAMVGKYLRISSMLGWIIPTGGKETYSLSGKFTPATDRELERERLRGNVRINWAHTLTLPPVALPTTP